MQLLLVLQHSCAVLPYAGAYRLLKAYDYIAIAVSSMVRMQPAPEPQRSGGNVRCRLHKGISSSVMTYTYWFMQPVPDLQRGGDVHQQRQVGRRAFPPQGGEGAPQQAG